MNAARGAWLGLALGLLITPGVAQRVPDDGTEPSFDDASEPTFARELGLDLSNAPWRGDLPGMIERRLIRALVPYSKTLYFVDLGGQQRGISHDFMRAFEDGLNRDLSRGELKVHVVFVPVPRDQLLPALLDGRGDVAAADLTITPERARRVAFVAPAARGVREIVVTGPGARPLRTLDDLAGQEILVGRATSYWEHLQQLDARLRRSGRAGLRLREAPGHFETEDVLEMLEAGLAKITVADSYHAKLWSEVFGKIRVHDELVMNAGGDIAFAVRRDSPKLKAALDAFTRTHGKGTTFGNVTLRKYLRDTRWVREATSPAELKKFEQLVGLFSRYGKQYDIDWLLMAAQGYQESQLDHSRRSAVGAIGIMQIMPATGAELAVGDIRELEPNIHAGVKYVRRLIDRHFAEPGLEPVERMLFAFAAYNAGPGRVRSLRREARASGLDANRWFNHVEQVAARRIGRETVQYVANIYKYYVAYKLASERISAASSTQPEGFGGATRLAGAARQADQRLASNR